VNGDASLFGNLNKIKIPTGIEVDCDFFDPPLKGPEVEEIRIYQGP
jgi:hypothetical protein